MKKILGYGLRSKNKSIKETMEGYRVRGLYKKRIAAQFVSSKLKLFKVVYEEIEKSEK